MKRYAQEIAESTAQVLGFDVVITDTEGVIVGASDTSRLGTKNLPSLEVMAKRKGIAHDKEEAKHYEANRPGIMYPLENTAGEVVGAMAITGNPDQVRPLIDGGIFRALSGKSISCRAYPVNNALKFSMPSFHICFS